MKMDERKERKWLSINRENFGKKSHLERQILNIIS